MEWISLLIISILNLTFIQGDILSVCPNYHEGKQSRTIAAADSGYIVSHPDYGFETYGANQHCELTLKDAAIGEFYIIVEELRIEPVEDCEPTVENMKVPVIGRGCLIDQSGGDFTYGIDSFMDHEFLNRPTDLIFSFDTNHNSNEQDYGFKVWYGTNVQTICESGQTNTTVDATASGRIRSHTDLFDTTFNSPVSCTYNILEVRSDTVVMFTFKYLDICAEEKSPSNQNYLEIGDQAVVCPHNKFVEPFMARPNSEGKIIITYYSPQKARGFLLEYQVLEDDDNASEELELFSNLFTSTETPTIQSALKPTQTSEQNNETDNLTEKRSDGSTEPQSLVEDEKLLISLILCIVAIVTFTAVIIVGILLWRRRQNVRSEDLKSNLPTNYDRNSVYYSDITGIDQNGAFHQISKPITNHSYADMDHQIYSMPDDGSHDQTSTFARKESEDDLRYILPGGMQDSNVKLYSNDLYQPAGEDNSTKIKLDDIHSDYVHNDLE